MRATLERLSNSMKRFKLPRSRLRKYRLSELFKKDKQVHTCLGYSSRALISRSVLSLSLDSHCWWLSFSLTDLLGDTALEIQTLWILSKVITVKFDNSAEFANFQSLHFGIHSLSHLVHNGAHQAARLLTSRFKGKRTEAMNVVHFENTRTIKAPLSEVRTIAQRSSLGGRKTVRLIGDLIWFLRLNLARLVRLN